MANFPSDPSANSPDQADSTAIVELLIALSESIGFAVDRLDARRAVSQAFRDGPDVGLRPGDLLDVEHALADAAERLGMRLTARRLPLSEAIQLKNVHAAVGLAGGASGTASWYVVQRAGWRRVDLRALDGTKASLSPAELASQLGLASPGESVLAFVAAVASPYPHPTDVGHSAHGSDSKSHHAGHDADHGHSHLSPFRRLIGILRPEAGDIWVVTVFSAVVGLLALASPVAVEALVNTVAFGRLIQPLVVLCVLLFTFLVFAAVLRVLQAFVAEIIQRRIFVRVVADLAHRLPRVEQAALDREHGPELLNRFFDVMTVQKSAALLVLDGIAIALQAVIGMVVLAFYHPYLFGFDLFLISSLGFATFVLGIGAVRTAVDESKAKYKVAAWLEELAGYTLTFKTDGGARRAWDVADRLAADYIRHRRRHFHVLVRQIVFAVGLQAVTSSLLLALGGWLVLNGQLTLGQLVAAELIVAVLVGSFAKLGKQLETFYDLLAAVDKLGHLFDLPIERNTGSAPAASDRGFAVRLHDAEYAFGDEHVSFAHLSLDVKAGEMVAIAGRPGSGKSVLLDLLYVLRHPSAGRVELDGDDTRSLQPSAVRRQAALVRDGEVVSGTVAENVHLDRPGIGLSDVRAALAQVGLLSEVLGLPNGLETEVRPGGKPLSDSQARRLLLARALAGRPRLLLIDGLLDSLPDDALPQVMAALSTVRRHCTIIIVTGRHDVADACDRLITSDSPQGAPSGRHGGPSSSRDKSAGNQAGDLADTLSATGITGEP